MDKIANKKEASIIKLFIIGIESIPLMRAITFTIRLTNGVLRKENESISPILPNCWQCGKKRVNPEIMTCESCFEEISEPNFLK